MRPLTAAEAAAVIARIEALAAEIRELRARLELAEVR